MNAATVRTPSPADVLALWETGQARHPIDRALLLAHHTAEAGDVEQGAASWSLGRRDVHLLRVRQAMYGDALECRSTCPACGEVVEVALACSALLDAAVVSDRATESAGEQNFEFEHVGIRVRFRLLDSRDLAAIAGLDDVMEARDRLIERCLVSAVTLGGESIRNLPNEVAVELAAHMGAADPGAEFLLDLVCPACAEAWQTTFDITTWLWDELSLESRGTLLEVDALARAYGWTEAEVLELAPMRRAMYLDLVHA